MSRVYNFSAGPAVLPEEVLKEAAAEMLDYNGTGMSVMEMSQLMALRYGTVPIVRETGGLKDTVWPYNEYDGTGTGFSFANYNAHEMLDCIRYAKYIYYNKKREWNKIVDRGMAADFSWQTSAGKYQELYDWLIGY